MDILSKITDVIGDSLFGKVVDAVEKYFPPSMTDKEKSDLKVALLQIENDQTVKLANISRDIQEQFETRIREMEGTTSDLKGVPFLGPLVIFLRGMQRPVWGFAVMFMDFQVFGNKWNIQPDTSQDTAFMIVNLLVLGFLFGERAFQNIAPLIDRYIRPGAK